MSEGLVVASCGLYFSMAVQCQALLMMNKRTEAMNILLKSPESHTTVCGELC